MPYTPPSISTSGLHSVSPIRSSYSYAGLSNSHEPSSTTIERPTSSTTKPGTHNNYHSRPKHHRRSSSGPTSLPTGPIPVASFAQVRPSPKCSHPTRRTRSSSRDSDDDQDNKTSLRSPHGRCLDNLKELRDAIREQ